MIKHHFRKKGYLIGSGRREAAIMQVFQQRLKLSDQRCTIQGAQQIAHLRVPEKVGNGKKLYRLLKTHTNLHFDLHPHL